MPSAAGDRYHMVPLSGRPAERILMWAGIPREFEEAPLPGSGLTRKKYVAAYWTLIEHFDTMNAQERHGPWDLRAAQARWTRYLMEDERSRKPLVVVCLGRRAQAAIGTAGPDWGEWREAGLLQYVTIPHPSGQNRLYNDPPMVETAVRVLREARSRAVEAVLSGPLR